MAADWREWHRHYDDPDSRISRRLVVVQRLVATCLSDAAPGEIRVLSLCAGDGRDLFGALEGHPRRAEVRALLVELDDELAGAARARAAAEGLDRVEVRRADASLTANVEGGLPADLLMLCGIFGNVSSDDIARTVLAAASMVTLGAHVIWTRHRGEPDLTPSIRRWFAEAGFAEVDWSPVEGTSAAVGCHRLVEVPLERSLPERLFTFDGDGHDAHT